MVSKPKISWQKLTLVSAAAGVIYNSWPLGYVLNPVVARKGLASELAGRGQPYAWLFTYGDVVCGLLMLALCWQLWSYLKPPDKRLAGVTLGGMVVFCAGTIIAALYQVHCIAALQQCPSFTRHFLTFIHGITSVVASLGLFVGLASLLRREPANRLLMALVVIYAGLGSWTLVILLQQGQGVLILNAFITLTGLCLASYPWLFYRALEPLFSQKSPGL